MTLFSRDPCSFSDWLSFRFEFSSANSSQSETRDGSMQNYMHTYFYYWLSPKRLFEDHNLRHKCRIFGAKRGVCLCGALSSQASQCCYLKFWHVLVCRCLADSPYADVCFLVHGVPMPAHRVILNARSSYFAHMFMSKWRDRPIIELKHKLVRSPEGLIVL